MSDAEVRIIDWARVEQAAYAAYDADSMVIDRNDFVAGFKYGYQMILTEDRKRLAAEIAAAIKDEDRWRFVEGEGRARFDSARIALEVAEPASGPAEPVPGKVQCGGVKWTYRPNLGYYEAGVGRMTPTRVRTLLGEGRATVID